MLANDFKVNKYWLYLFLFYGNNFLCVYLYNNLICVYMYVTKSFHLLHADMGFTFYPESTLSITTIAECF